MARTRPSVNLWATKRHEMVVLWTTAAYVVFASGVALTAYILMVWMRASRR
jgi:hypothetical protein